jgi:hypothetical protein
MKIIVGFIPVVFFALFSSAQVKKIDSILKMREIKTPYYMMDEAGCKVMYLPLEYGKFKFTVNQAVFVQELKNANIAGVDLVYSDYPAKSDFTALSRKRLESLNKILPGLFTNENTRFRKIRQTEAKSREEASYLAHGFYIYYRELPGKETAAREIKKLKDMISGDVPLADTGPLVDSVALTDTVPKYCSMWSLETDTLTFRDTLAGYTRSIVKMSKKDAFADSLIPMEYYKSYDGFDSVYYVLDVNKDSCGAWGDVYAYTTVDSTVAQVFRRHKWSKAMILADVTGSMYPYTGQLLVWLKLTMTDRQQRQFVFFNDGDAKTDKEKIIGKTGGIYKIVTADYNEVQQTIEKAMANGGGGDAPENNIEALIDAERNCISCDSVVMIADNWAPVKDIALLGSIKKPVKVVLCGVYDKVNPDYLNIARKTGGSLHLIEQDIYELSKMKEGEVIEIKGTKYRIVDGLFKIMDERVI